MRNLSADAITDQIDGVRDPLFEVLQSQRRLPAFVDVAIGLHEWRFYGSADTDHRLTSVRTKRFASNTLYPPARTRFTLAVVPIDANGFRAKPDPVRSLLETVKQHTSIRHVYLDREFYQIHVVTELGRQDINYIVRARPSIGIRGRLSAGAETVAEEYMMQRKRKRRLWTSQSPRFRNAQVKMITSGS